MSEKIKQTSSGMKFLYPADCKTTEQKITFCYAAQEKLRLLHNSIGQQYRAHQITQEAWDEWKQLVFNPRQKMVSKEICSLKEKMKEVTLDIDLDDIFVEESV